MKKLMKNSWNNSRHNEVPNVTAAEFFTSQNNNNKSGSCNSAEPSSKKDKPDTISLEDDNSRRLSLVSTVSSESIVSSTETNFNKSKSQIEISDSESLSDEANNNNEILFEEEEEEKQFAVGGASHVTEWLKSSKPSATDAAASPTTTTTTTNNKIYKTKRSIENGGAGGVTAAALIHECKDCSRTFKDVNNYKEHRFQEHQVTEYQNVRKCSLCSYATLLKSKYDCHMRCHLNNKVIKCQRCEYSTINIRHMSRHERMHMLQSNPAIKPLLVTKAAQINENKKVELTEEINRKNKLKNSGINETETPKKRKINSFEFNPRSDKSSVNINNNNNNNNNDEPIVISQKSRFTDPSMNISNDYNEQIDFKILINSLRQFDEIKGAQNKRVCNEETSNYDNNNGNYSSPQCNRVKCKYNEAAHSPNLITPPASTVSSSSPPSDLRSPQPLLSASSSSSSFHSTYSSGGTFQTFGQQNGKLRESTMPASYYDDAQSRASNIIYSMLTNDIAFKFLNSSQHSNNNMNNAGLINECKFGRNLTNECLTGENKMRHIENSCCGMQHPQHPQQQQQQQQQQQPIPTQPHRVNFDLEQTCCLNQSFCLHRQELEMLRKNVFMLLQNLAPKLIYSLKLNASSIEYSNQIDKIVEYLSTQVGSC